MKLSQYRKVFARNDALSMFGVNENSMDRVNSMGRVNRGCLAVCGPSHVYLRFGDSDNDLLS